MVADVISARIPALAEIEAFVKQSLTRDIRSEKARALAEDALQRVRAGESLEQAASATNLTFEQTEPFTRMTFVPGIGKENSVVAHAFALDKGQTSGVIEYAGQFFIIRVDEKIPVDEATMEGDMANIRMSLVSTKQQAYLSDWYEGLKAQVEIEDYRTLAPY
jgi:hypothetical protein